MSTRQVVGVALLSCAALVSQSALAKTLRFSADNFNPFSGSTPSPVGSFSGVVKYQEPRQRYTYGTIYSFQVQLDGVAFNPTNTTVFLTAEPNFGVPLLDFEGDVSNFDSNGNTLHFLLVNEYSYGAALNLGVNGGPLQWQSLDVRTRPRNPVPSLASADLTSPVPDAPSAALSIAGVAVVAAMARRRRLSSAPRADGVGPFQIEEVVRSRPSPHV